jgi:hypothetical protein
MKNQQEILNSNHKELAQIKSVAYYLEELSENLYQVGNELLSRKICQSASDLFNAVETLKTNNSDSLTLRVEESQQATANMLNMALAIGAQK